MSKEECRNDEDDQRIGEPPDEDDDLVDQPITTNPEFQALLRRSLASSRVPFAPAK